MAMGRDQQAHDQQDRQDTSDDDVLCHGGHPSVQQATRRANGLPRMMMNTLHAAVNAPATPRRRPESRAENVRSVTAMGRSLAPTGPERPHLRLFMSPASFATV